MVHLKHLHTVRRKLADGSYRTHYYHRRTRKRISGEFGSPEFLASYAEAEKISRKEVDSNTLGSLLAQYRQSTSYKNKAAATRRNYEPILATLHCRWSSMPLSVVDHRSVRKGMIELRDQIAKRSLRQADYHIQVLSAVLAFGVDIGAIQHNHARGIAKVYKADRTERIWLPEDVNAFEAVASPELRLALQLGLHTGQREKDLIELPWSAYDGSAITLTQSKTGRSVYIPCTSALLKVLTSTRKNSPIIMTNTHGRPWTQSGFQTSWRKASIRAGIQGRLTFHDLRGTTVTMLAESGCTIPEIATITGHSFKAVDQILERYLSRTKVLATAAILKVDQRSRIKNA